MNACSCKNTCECSFVAVVVSFIVGIVAAFLNFSATIAVPSFVLWIFFGVALIFLALALFSAHFVCGKEIKGCICSTLKAFFAGIFGTVLFALILVLVDLAAGLLASVITGLLFAAFALTITSAACLIRCLLNCN